VLASPSRGSGRVILPSLFPVVPAQRARLGLRRPELPPAAEVETAVHEIFEVPKAPVHVLGTDLPEIDASVDPDGDGSGGRPRSIGPIDGSGGQL
jgi:hypothetical protein